MKHRSLLTTFTTCVTTLAFCGNALAAGGAPVFALRALAAGERNMQPRLPLDPAATRDQLIRLRSSALNGTLRNTLGTFGESSASAVGGSSATFFVSASERFSFTIGTLPSTVGGLTMRVQLPHPAETASAAGGALRYTYQATSAAPNELLRRRHPEIRGLEADLNRSVFVYSFDREPDADIAGFITRVAQPLKTILRRGQTSWGVFSAAHPREAPAMRDAARQFVRDYSRLTRATSDAQRTLKRRVGAAKVVSKQAVLDELGKLIPATAPWPRVQQQVSVAQREIAGINGDEINFEQSMIYFSWIFPEMVKQYDTLSFLGVAPAQVVAQGWRDAFRLAWFEHIEAVSGAISQDPAASLPDREVLIADALDMFKAGNISAHSELEDCYYETAKGLAQPLSAALPLTPYPICGEGIMYLDKENRPVSVFEGGDCVALAQTLSVRFNPYSINDRWFPGEQPVFCDPVFSGNGNALQLQAYLEDMDKLNRLPGMPRPLFAAVSPDVVTVYRLVPGVTQAQVYQLLDRSLNVVRIGHTLRDLFDRHINDFPVEAGTNAKMVDDVTKNRARSLASAVADQVVARIPELAQRGISSGTISEIFKADLAELRGLKIGKRREAGQVSRGELQKRIVQLAIRIEMYLSERLAEDIFRDQAYFEIVEIPGLTNAPACRGELDALVGEVNGFLGGSVDLDATAFEARVAPFEARVAAMLQANGQWASVKEALGAVRAHIDAVRQARALTQQYGTSLVTGVDERGALAEIRGVYDRLDLASDTACRERLADVAAGICQRVVQGVIAEARTLDSAGTWRAADERLALADAFLVSGEVTFAAPGGRLAPAQRELSEYRATGRAQLIADNLSAQLAAFRARILAHQKRDEVTINYDTMSEEEIATASESATRHAEEWAERTFQPFHDLTQEIGNLFLRIQGFTDRFELPRPEAFGGRLRGDIVSVVDAYVPVAFDMVTNLDDNGLHIELTSMLDLAANLFGTITEAPDAKELVIIDLERIKGEGVRLLRNATESGRTLIADERGFLVWAGAVSEEGMLERSAGSEGVIGSTAQIMALVRYSEIKLKNPKDDSERVFYERLRRLAEVARLRQQRACQRAKILPLVGAVAGSGQSLVLAREVERGI